MVFNRIREIALLKSSQKNTAKLYLGNQDSYTKTNTVAKYPNVKDNQNVSSLN